MNRSRKHLFLIGFRGVGKTTVAAILGDALNLPVVDLDQEIESTAGVSIRSLFAQRGEAVFRRLEQQTLRACVGRTASIMSTGGGIVLDPANRKLLANSGLAVWLTASSQTLIQRIEQDPGSWEQRPALSDSLTLQQEVESLLSQRAPYYNQCADTQVDTDGRHPQDIASEIIRWWNDVTV